MFSIVKVLTCLALLCTWSAFILAQDSPIRSFSKKFTMSEARRNFSTPPPFTFYSESGVYHLYRRKHDNYSLYSVCQPKQDSNFISCNVTIRSWPHPRVNSLTICKNYEMFGGNDFDIWTYRMSENIILFILDPRQYMLWDIDYYKSNIYILNMENCSNVADISFVSKMKKKGTRPINVIVYDKTFEIIVRNETYCNGMPVCKINYDLNGNQTGGPKPFEMEKSALLFPVSLESPDKGYYTKVVKNDEICEVQHVDSSGKRRKLMTVPVKLCRVGSTIDWRNELFTICYSHQHDSREFHCLQTDTQGMRLNVTIELPTYGRKVAVYNLAGGGILMSFGLCDIEIFYPPFEVLSCKEFQIQRIGAGGHMFKPLVIDGFDKTDVFNFYEYRWWITENDHNEFCFPMEGSLRLSNKTVSTPESLHYKWCIPKEWTL